MRADSDVPKTVIAGFSSFGLAGLTAVDYLADHLDLAASGYVRAEGLPTITPFEEGRPRHATEILTGDDFDAAVLKSELFVPVWAAERFGKAVIEWTEDAGVEEVTILSGIPIAHGPDDHRTFHVAADDYREARLADADVPPMRSGFLDGVEAALVEHGMTTDMRVGVLITPVHAQGPDADAALRLLETVQEVHGMEFDTDPLREFSDRVKQYYAGLSERLDKEAEADRPDDRMFM